MYHVPFHCTSSLSIPEPFLRPLHLSLLLLPPPLADRRHLPEAVPNWAGEVQAEDAQVLQDRGDAGDVHPVDDAEEAQLHCGRQSK